MTGRAWADMKTCVHQWGQVHTELRVGPVARGIVPYSWNTVTFLEVSIFKTPFCCSPSSPTATRGHLGDQ